MPNRILIAGAGIQLGPNAFHAFDALGVGDTARAMAVYVDRLRLMDAMTAEEITHIDLGKPFRQRFGNPYAVTHCGDCMACCCATATAIPVSTPLPSAGGGRGGKRHRPNCSAPSLAPTARGGDSIVACQPGRDV